MLYLTTSYLFSADLNNKQDPLYELEQYFKSETFSISSKCLSNIKTKEDWEKNRPIYKQQIMEMLGLYPEPERTPLNPVITGKVETDSFTVEKLHFQSMPGLYVTANLYIPKNTPLPAPAVLYLCGHSYPLKKGFYHGNKVNYQHHAIWFAQNGYVCLVIDTLQLGEIPGLHHGTYREGMWWWNSRGYTPAGVEAWNTTRSIDYLYTRSEVDTNRIGVTGRSGGGSYSWTAMAIDERIKVAAPVAGITDLQNYVVDGTVEGHCDCMFFVNTYRWDYPLLAALSAPRPLLICNTDSDTIFPLDGVERLHFKVKQIYSLLNAKTNLGFVIVPGPHKDIQELQVPVFRWFNRFLKGVDIPVAQTTTNLFEPETLKVFDAIPQDQINSNVHKLFVPMAALPEIPGDIDKWRELTCSITNLILEKSFGGWPTKPGMLSVAITLKGKYKNLDFEVIDFSPQVYVNLKLFLFMPAGKKSIKTVELKLLDAKDWENFAAELYEISGGKCGIKPTAKFGSGKELAQSLNGLKDKAIVYFAPRGIGTTDWELPPEKMKHILRRFMLLGQTLEGMRVWDIRMAVSAIHSLGRMENANIVIFADETMAINAVFAAIFEPSIKELYLENLPQTYFSAPDYLNILKFMDIPMAFAIASERARINAQFPSEETKSSLFSYAIEVSKKFGWQQNITVSLIQ